MHQEKGHDYPNGQRWRKVKTFIWISQRPLFDQVPHGIAELNKLCTLGNWKFPSRPSVLAKLFPFALQKSDLAWGVVSRFHWAFGNRSPDNQRESSGFVQSTQLCQGVRTKAGEQNPQRPHRKSLSSGSTRPTQENDLFLGCKIVFREPLRQGALTVVPITPCSLFSGC